MHFLITGAAGGVGQALAREFAGPDARLTLADLNLEPLRALEKELSCSVLACEVDLSRLDTCCDFVEEAERAHGPVDVLINNAAIDYVEPAVQVSTDRGERLFRINFLAPHRLMNRIVPGMVERGSGTVVNVASVTAITPVPNQAHYSAAKSGLSAYSEALRSELRGSGVHVMTVYPGPIHTEMDRYVRDRLQPSLFLTHMPTGRSAKLARLIHRGIRKSKVRIVYPRAYSITRWFNVTCRWLTFRSPPQLR